MTDMQTNKDDKRKLTNKKYYENKRKTKKSLIESDSESTTSYNTENKKQTIPTISSTPPPPPPPPPQTSFIDNFIITNLLNEINSIKNNYQILQNETNNIKTELVYFKSQNQILQNEINNIKTELVYFKSQNQILQNELNNFKLQSQTFQTDNNLQLQFQELKNEIMFLKQNSGGDKRTTNNKRLVIHNDESNKASEIVESSTAPMPSAAPLTPLKLLNEKCNETQDYNKFLTFEYNRLNKKGDFDPTEDVDKLALKLFRAELKDIKKSNWSIYCFNIRKKEVYIRKENKWCIPIFTDWEYIIKSAFSKVAATIIQWGTKKRVENEGNISDSHDQAIIQTIIYAANFKEKFFSSKVKVDNMIHKIMELCLVSVEEIEYDLTQITPKTDPLPDPEDISTLMQRKKKRKKKNKMK